MFLRVLNSRVVAGVAAAARATAAAAAAATATTRAFSSRRPTSNSPSPPFPPSSSPFTTTEPISHAHFPPPSLLSHQHGHSPPFPPPSLSPQLLALLDATNPSSWYPLPPPQPSSIPATCHILSHAKLLQFYPLSHQTVTIRYPAARASPRSIIAHIGPTNSGKTR